MTYFKPVETRCKCGCGMDIRPELLDQLNWLRSQVGVPLTVHSGARCLKRNAQVRGARNSLHLRGLAADLGWPPDPSKRWLLVSKASERFSGLGFYDTFIHVDLRDLVHMPHSSWTDVE